MPTNPAVFVFAMEGCGACEEYLPRFKQIAGPYRRALPIGIYDVSKGGKPAQFGDKLGVRATPTTIVMDRRGHFHRAVGALADRAIKQLLDRAVG